MLARHKLVLEFWDRSKELHIKNKEYKNFVNKFFKVLLENDLRSGDISTNSIIKNNKKIIACIIAKECGIIAGLEEFSFLNRDLKLKLIKKDGDEIRNGDIVAEITGNAKKILERERISLNLLQRLSGIATLTCNLSKKLNKIKIAATRKTLWGLLDKKAVSIGNGLTHRLSLNDGVIVKDNHLKLLNYDFEKIINKIKNKSKYIEIEVENKKQVLKAAITIKKNIKRNNKNIFAVMLDKIPPQEIKSIINEMKKMDIYDRILFEASGNINSDNIIKYKNCGVNVISMGQLTNSARALNMSLEVK